MANYIYKTSPVEGSKDYLCLYSVRLPGQVVFSLLAQKADSLNPKTIISGWLWRTTRNASSVALRTQRRRERREQQAYMQAQLNEPAPDVWTQIEPLLETAIAQLGA